MTGDRWIRRVIVAVGLALAVLSGATVGLAAATPAGVAQATEEQPPTLPNPPCSFHDCDW